MRFAIFFYLFDEPYSPIIFSNPFCLRQCDLILNGIKATFVTLVNLTYRILYTDWAQFSWFFFWPNFFSMLLFLDSGRSFQLLHSKLTPQTLLFTKVILTYHTIAYICSKNNIKQEVTMSQLTISRKPYTVLRRLRFSILPTFVSLEIRHSKNKLGTLPECFHQMKNSNSLVEKFFKEWWFLKE